MTDTETPAERSFPMTDWSLYISTRANALFLGKDRPEKLAALLQERGITVAPELIDCWLHGYNAPQSPSLHRALMLALDLPNSANPRSTDYLPPRLSIPSTNRLAALRAEIEAAYARIDPVYKTDVIASGMHGVAENGMGFNGPARDAASYVLTAPKVLLAWYQAKRKAEPKYSKQAFAEDLQLQSGSLSVLLGGGLAGSRKLQALSTHLTDADDRAWLMQYENAVITDRLVLSRVRPNAMQYIHEMPPRYWDAVLAQYTDPAGWAARLGKPIWAAESLPEPSKTNYLQAVRLYHGLSLDDLTTALDIGQGTLRDHMTDGIKTGKDKDVVAFLKALPESRFDQAIYDALPLEPAPTRSSKNSPLPAEEPSWQSRMLHQFLDAVDAAEQNGKQTGNTYHNRKNGKVAGI